MFHLVNILFCMNNLEKIGVAIRKKRNDLGISQEDLAGNAEIDRSYLSGIENGRRRVSLEMYIKVVQAMGVEPWEIMKDAFPKKNS